MYEGRREGRYQTYKMLLICEVRLRATQKKWQPRGDVFIAKCTIPAFFRSFFTCRALLHIPRRTDKIAPRALELILDPCVQCLLICSVPGIVLGAVDTDLMINRPCLSNKSVLKRKKTYFFSDYKRARCLQKVLMSIHSHTQVSTAQK